MNAPDVRLLPEGLMSSRLRAAVENKNRSEHRALTSSRWRLREAASVLAAVDPATLRPTAGSEAFDDRARLDFMGDLAPVETDETGACWTLANGIRQLALQRLRRSTPEDTRRRLQETLALNPDPPPILAQRLMEQAIAGTLPSLDTMNRPELCALATISNWLRALIDGMPDATALSRALGRAEFLHPRRRLADEFFVGRDDEQQRLADHIGVLPVETSDTLAYIGRHARRIGHLVRETIEGHRRFLFVHGPGGIGKSTLISRFILDHTTRPEASLPFIVIDVDRPEIDPLNPLTFLVEGIQQLLQQGFETMRGPLEELAEQALESLDRRDTSALEALVDDSTFVIRRFSETIRRSIEGRPLVFIVDTFEEVQYLGTDVEHIVISFMEKLAEALPDLRVIMVGRTRPTRSGFYIVPVEELPEVSAKILLQSLLTKAGTPFTVSDLGNLVGLVGGNPMALRLAARLFASDDRRSIDEASRRDWFQRLRVETLQARLYGRILSHLHDPDVRKLAFPGLVVRRIDAGVIKDVLARACDLSVATVEDAQLLLTKFSKEVALVTEQPDGSYLYRPDVRRIMLETLHETLPKGAIAAIDETAVRFWKERDGPAARAEEIYHRLRLAHDRETLERCWRSDAAPYLRSALGEVPESSRHWLAHKLGASLDAEARANAIQSDWEQSAARTAQRLLTNGEVDEALRILRERPERLGASPLYALEARTLYLLNRFEEARAVVTQGREALTRGGDAPAIVDLYLLDALLYEREGNLGEAQAIAARAVEEAHIAGVRLPLLRALLRLLRIQRKLDDHVRSLQSQALQVVDLLGLPRLSADSILLRDAAAELGDISAPLLLAAMDRAGVDVLAGAHTTLVMRILQSITQMNENEISSIIRGDPRELAKLAAGALQAALASQADAEQATQLAVELFRDAGERSITRQSADRSPLQSAKTVRLDARTGTALVRLVVEHFSAADLRRTLRFYLSRDLSVIMNTAQPFEYQIRQLFEQATSEGWLPGLLSALYASSRSNEVRQRLESLLPAGTVSPKADASGNTA